MDGTATSSSALASDFRSPVALGRTGLRVGRLGIASSYGVPAAAIERAFREHGLNYFYWGSIRRPGMRDAIRSLARTDRDRIVVALQSYDRTGPLMRTFVERGLRALGIDHADVLILGWHNGRPPARIVDAAERLRADGKIRFLAISGHNRPLFATLANEAASPFDILMFRYNAAHRGAELEVFPFLPADRPGVTCYTATRWGQLLDPKRMPASERPLTAADCYRFVLSNPLVDLCMTGPANAEQMDEALRALELGPMSSEEMERARRIGDYVRK
jgi:aryl-alcohol dehydrogenase-like predicted oxidoreductase